MKEPDMNLLDRLNKEVGTYGLDNVVEGLLNVAQENVAFLSNHPEVDEVAELDVEQWARSVIILETAERSIANLDMDNIPY